MFACRVVEKLYKVFAFQFLQSLHLQYKLLYSTQQDIKVLREHRKSILWDHQIFRKNSQTLDQHLQYFDADI
ncbi:MAG: hypothetical protein AYK18_04200 [Theionarchaea archaeon DG-70]|nr:MAG: hypothetical protein AYK18_04200 [Theionarchaea archaeon DG-70]